MAQPTTFQPADSHLVAERHDVLVRGRLLARLTDSLGRGIQDPELLYLGARFAVSMGQGRLALRFLDPLRDLLYDGNRPTPAFFPVGVLYLRALPPEDDRRRAIVQELQALAGALPRLARVLSCVGADPEGRFPAGSPQRWLDLIKQYFGESLWSDLALPGTGGGQGGPHGDSNLLGILQRLHREANQAYEAGSLGPAREALEMALLLDGDQPAVLRNLVTIASEQRDLEAYGRYWRRFVKLLLWRIMRRDGVVAAYEDLFQFYQRVATATDREFKDEPKTIERLRMPGLLPRWLESHAALIWLDSVLRAHRTEQTNLSIEELRNGRLGHVRVMHYWFCVFYPEFAGFLHLGETGKVPDVASDACQFVGRYPRVSTNPVQASGEQAKAGSADQPKSHLPFSPVEQVLSRFAKWSRFHFALENDHDSHAETVAALAGFVARLPLRPHARMLRAALATDELRPAPLRRSLQQACSLPLRFALGRFLPQGDQRKESDQDWKGLIDYYGDPDLQECLAPDLRMLLAFAHCRCEQPQQALEIACHTLPDMGPEDLEKDAQNGSLWRSVVRANLQAVPNQDSGQRQATIGKLKARLEAIPVDGPRDEFRKACIREILMHEQVDRAVHESRELAKQKKWAEAKKVVRRIPDDEEELKELKQSLLRQIDEAEAHAKLHERIEKAIEESKALVAKDKFREATDVIRRLPDDPDDLRELKANLLQQISQAENHSKLNKSIEQAIEESKTLVGKGKFREAKDVVRRLPDEPKELIELKRNLLGQIDAAEQQSQVHQRIEAALDKSKKLVGQGKFAEAKEAIRKLPDQPAELKDLKKNFLGQIEQVERDAKKATSENVEIMGRLARRGITAEVVLRIAKDNNVNTSNTLEFNALLKAIERQAP